MKTSVKWELTTENFLTINNSYHLLEELFLSSLINLIVSFLILGSQEVIEWMLEENTSSVLLKCTA